MKQEDLEVYRTLFKRGELKLKVYELMRRLTQANLKRLISFAKKLKKSQL